MTRIKIYTGFERLWHWLQALLILLLMITGFEIHFSWFSLFGYENAVEWHRYFAWAMLIVAAFAIFWHMTSGEWKQYMPKRYDKPGAMFEYYLVGIFKMRKHPARKRPDRKLNPLQKMVYLAFKLLIFPVIVVTGLVMMYWGDVIGPVAPEWLSFGLVAAIHTMAAFFLIAFLFGHVYMTTTGYTKSSNLKAMLSGFEEFDDETLADVEHA